MSSGRSPSPGWPEPLRPATAYTVVGTCKHLGIDPFGYLREALMGLFELGEKPTAEQLAEWLPDRWLLRRSNTPAPTAAAS